MWNAIKDVLGGLFGSKKFLTTAAGVIVALFAKLGLDLPDGLVLGILGLIGTYVLGQGIADHGKEAAKIQQDIVAGEDDGFFSIGVPAEDN